MLPNELLGLVGLAQRAGKVVVGSTAVRNEIRRRKALLLIFAADFSSSARERLLARTENRPPVLEIGTMQEWGHFFGRQQVGVIAVTDRHFVAGIMQKVKSLSSGSGLSEKIRLRDRVRAFRRQLDPAWKAAASRAIISRLESLPAFQLAQTIHTYVSWQNEVENHDLIRRLLQEGRRVAVPKIEPSGRQLQHYFITEFAELQPGAFGILEPVPDQSRIALPEEFDLVLVPGIAFDHFGNRLGLGKGYYDRFLAHIRALKIAPAFAFQIIEKVPAEPHDQRVDMIVTEKGVIECSQTKYV
jgi:5-formyltetrahydrofolate cyclo-ligase